jgi:plasmid recombination enzyme
MGRSYSLHISSKQHSLNNSNSISGAYNHNYRKYLEHKNYNRDKIIELVENACYTVKEFKKRFNEVFEDEVIKYNANQKQDDRKILDYYKKVEKAEKTEVAVEIIIQVCDKEFWEEHQDKRDKMLDVFKEQLDFFKKEVPEFVVTNCTLHQDEASPHLHLIGIPRGYGFKKGMQVRCSKRSVFTQSRLKKLQKSMRDNAEMLMRKYVVKDFQMDEKQKGRNIDFSKEDIIAIKKEKKIREEVKEELKQDEDLKKEVKEELQNDVNIRNEVKQVLKRDKNLTNGILQEMKEDEEIKKEVTETVKKDLLKDPSLREQAIATIKLSSEVRELAIERLEKDRNLRNMALDSLKKSPKVMYDLQNEMKNDEKFKYQTMKKLVQEWDLSENTENHKELVEILKEDEYFKEEMLEKCGKEALRNDVLVRTMIQDTSEYLMKDFEEDFESDYENAYDFATEVKNNDTKDFIELHSTLHTINLLKIQKAMITVENIMKKAREMVEKLIYKLGWESKKSNKQNKTSQTNKKGYFK